MLLVEQSYSRLKYADHKFHLSVNISGNNNVGYTLIWSILNTYDYQPFSVNNISELPIGKNLNLKLHDGLSHYLTIIGVAKEFKYNASWTDKLVG